MLAAARLALAALPQSRFIFVVRDGRAVVHSVITSELAFTSLPFLTIIQYFPISARLCSGLQGSVALASAGNVTVSGWSARDYEHNLRLWNAMVERMWRECVLLGVHVERASSPAASVGESAGESARCLPVPYELLVREPELWMRRVLAFLGLRFHHSVLQHPEHIASGAIRLSACASPHSSLTDLLFERVQLLLVPVR